MDYIDKLNNILLEHLGYLYPKFMVEIDGHLFYEKIPYKITKQTPKFTEVRHPAGYVKIKPKQLKQFDTQPEARTVTSRLRRSFS